MKSNWWATPEYDATAARTENDGVFGLLSIKSVQYASYTMQAVKQVRMLIAMGWW